MAFCQKIPDGALARLKEIAGAENVVTGEACREPYSHDETAGLSALPAAVVKPADTAQVSAVMRLSREFKIPVTPRGAGTGLSGGAVPVCSGIVLSLERMNRILEIDEANLAAVAQPGVITGKLQEAVEAKGLFYPPDPASLESCSIGGNIAENAGGPRAFKYGVTRKYLTGLEVVWPGGAVSRLGGKLIKNVSGYDLIGLVCGSEGTLAVVTEITLSLIPKPPADFDLLLPFPSVARAVEAATAMLRARVFPAALELMEKNAVALSERHLQLQAPCRDAGAQLIIQLDGPDIDRLEADAARIAEIAAGFGAGEALVAADKTSRERLWKVRRNIAEALNATGRLLAKEDVVVPRAAMPALFERFSAIGAKHGFETAVYGHIGDGNAHVNFLKKEGAPPDSAPDARPALKELFENVIALGGTLTGEHGIGCVKSEYMPLAFDPAALELMRNLKKLVDPENLLNPGKIF